VHIVFTGFICLGVWSCVFFCVVWFFVSTLAKRLAGTTYSCDIFRVEWFIVRIPNT